MDKHDDFAPRRHAPVAETAAPTWPADVPKPVVLVMGAGAVGGYFGAKLAVAGFPVRLVARGAHLAAIRASGLRVTGMIGDVTVPLPAEANPAAFGETPDLVVMGVKSMDTAGAITQMAAGMGPATQVLAIQNGIANYGELAAAFGADRVIRGYCRVGSEIAAPGHIHQTAFGEIVFGEEDGATTERIRQVDLLLRCAGIQSKPTPAIRAEVWKKFAWNVMFNMTTGLTGVTLDRLFADPDSEAVVAGLFGEVRAVAAHHGVALTDADYRSIIEPSRKLTGYKTSTMQDRLKGKPLEYGIFVGYLSGEGKRLNVPTPVADVIHGLFKTLDA
jgi:2-dehydropantoate 2-reductase